MARSATDCHNPTSWDSPLFNLDLLAVDGELDHLGLLRRLGRLLGCSRGGELGSRRRKDMPSSGGGSGEARGDGQASSHHVVNMKVRL